MCSSTFSPAIARQKRVAGRASPCMRVLKCAAGVCVSWILGRLIRRGSGKLSYTASVCAAALAQTCRQSLAQLELQMQNCICRCREEYIDKCMYNVSRWLTSCTGFRRNGSAGFHFFQEKKLAVTFLGPLKHRCRVFSDILIACGCTYSSWEQAKIDQAGHA